MKAGHKIEDSKKQLSMSSRPSEQYLNRPTTPTINEDSEFEFESRLSSAAIEVSANVHLCARNPAFVKRFGAILFATGGILNFVSFGYAAQSLLASLGSVQFISNVVFGRLVLGEVVVLKTWIATGVICFGNIFIVCFANRTSKDYTANDLRRAYSIGGYKFYCLAMLVLLFFVNRCYKSLGEAIAKGSAAERVNTNRYKTVQALCYALISAILGTQQMLQAKCLSELLRLSAEGQNQFQNPFLYAVLFIYCVATVFWLYRMNIALKRWDGLFIIPVLQVFWLVFTILSGGIYFDEFIHFSSGQLLGFVSGVFIVFFGVYLLMPPSTDTGSGDGTPLKLERLSSSGDSPYGDSGSFSEDCFDREESSNDDDRDNEFPRARRASSVSFGEFPVPAGLPPLGEGIPAPRRLSADGSMDLSGGDLEAANVSDNGSVSDRSVSSAGGSTRPRKLTREASAFGFDSEEVKMRDTRLLSFGFMPILTQDTKMVAIADWTIDQRRHWLKVEDHTSKLAFGLLNIGQGQEAASPSAAGAGAALDSAVVPNESGAGGRVAGGVIDGVIEMEPPIFRRRSSTADGAANRSRANTANATPSSGGGTVLKASSADFAGRGLIRRSYTQPTEEIKDLLATFDAEKQNKKSSLAAIRDNDNNASANL